MNFDIIIYFYSHNHSRRNITLHESYKQKIFLQPIYDLKDKKKISFKKNFDINDNIYINSKSKITYQKSKKKYINIFLYERLFLFSIIYDFFVGKEKLKDMNFLKNIKLFEKKKNYQWEFTEEILSSWITLSKKRNSRFIISNIPNFYNSPNINHYYGNNIAKLKERIYLKKICKKHNIKFYDNYKTNIKKFYNSNFFIHPRYSYLNILGYKYLINKVTNILKENIKFKK